MAVQQELDIERIVERPTWKQILLELIINERIDPRNIDIVLIADGFLKKIRDMKKFDLLIPANVILASAILLRHKSSYLQLYEPQPEVMAVAEESASEPEQIPVLTITSRIPPKRQITLEELAQEIERVIKYEDTVYTPKKKGGIDETINFNLTGDDIERTMDEIYKKIITNMDENGWVVFSTLIKGEGNTELVYHLLSILHLTQKELVDIKQDEVFGEILIKVNKEKITN